MDKPVGKFSVLLYGGVSERRGVFFRYGRAFKLSAAAPFSESGVK